MPFTVQQLIEGCPKPMTVLPDDPANKALELMAEYDYSQLPVVDEQKIAQGLVTSDSILRALSYFGVTVDKLQVSAAMVKAARFRPDEDLFELLAKLRDTYAVLIIDRDSRLIGMITSYDAMEYFRRRAEDMMYIEDIEVTLKDHIMAAFINESGETDQAALEAAIRDINNSKRLPRNRFLNALHCYLQLSGNSDPTPNKNWANEAYERLSDKEQPKAIDDLTLSDYAELLLHKSRWAAYGSRFGLDEDAIRRLLDGVRKTRNTLAHFRSEISEQQRAQLRFCKDWLYRHQRGILINLATGVSQTVIEKSVLKEPPGAYAVSAAVAAEIIPAEETREPDESRYAPLARWLQTQREDKARMTFEQIEQIIGDRLPESARQHRSWWANDAEGHVQSQQWLEAGWRVATLNMMDEQVTFVRAQERERAYIDFFSALCRALDPMAPFRIKDHTLTGANWHTFVGLPEAGHQMAVLAFTLASGKRARVELYIDSGDKDRNKQIFDQLHLLKGEMEAVLKEPLAWERLDNSRASRIALYRPGAITDSEQDLESLRQWAVEAIVRFYNAVGPVANRVMKAVVDTNS